MADLRPDRIFAGLIPQSATRLALLKVTEFLRALVLLSQKTLASSDTPMLSVLFAVAPGSGFPFSVPLQSRYACLRLPRQPPRAFPPEISWGQYVSILLRNLRQRKTRCWRADTAAAGSHSGRACRPETHSLGATALR